MTFEDFLEWFSARLKKAEEAGAPVPFDLEPLGTFSRIRELLEKAHVFLLDTTVEETKLMEEIGQDVLEELKTTLPCPFDNFAIVQRAGAEGPWRFYWVLRVVKYGTWFPVEGARPENQFLLWIYGSEADPLPDLTSAIRFWYVGGEGVNISIAESSITQYRKGTGVTEGDIVRNLHTIVVAVMLSIGAISHPANYRVERTALLSPREERRAARGEPRPARKKPHFIIVDHERLVNLNPATRRSDDSRASPVAHARRGHWRELAERCRRARVEGKTRIWIGDTYVGPREFADEKNRYVVFLSGQKTADPTIE